MPRGQAPHLQSESVGASRVWDADEEKEEEVAVACEAVRAEKPMDALWSCLMELMYVDVWCISVPVYEYRQHLSWAICIMI